MNSNFSTDSGVKSARELIGTPLSCTTLPSTHPEGCVPGLRTRTRSSMTIHCDYDTHGGGCEWAGGAHIYHINASTQRVLKCVGNKTVRLCVTHRRVQVCACCGNAAEGFTAAPRNKDVKRGLDFRPPWREPPGAIEVARAAGAHAATGFPGGLHQALRPCLCGTCDNRARKDAKAKVAKEQAARARQEAERTRAAAEEEARRPDGVPPSAPAAAILARALRSAASRAEQAPAATMRSSIRNIRQVFTPSILRLVSPLA
jgi:hypothetical protein